MNPLFRFGMIMIMTLALAAPLPLKIAAAHEAPAASEAAPPSALGATLRGLWLGHVEATRSYLFAVHDQRPGQAKAAADQVVANAKSIAGAVGNFYGKAAGEQMLTLLAGHWGAVKAYTDASAIGDERGREQAMQDLNANAERIADFLAGANPYLPRPALLGLLATHGAHHIAQIQQVTAGDLPAEAKTWQAMRAHMLVIADALAEGLVKQFPDKAKG